MGVGRVPGGFSEVLVKHPCVPNLIFAKAKLSGFISANCANGPGPNGNWLTFRGFINETWIRKGLRFQKEDGPGVHWTSVSAGAANAKLPGRANGDEGKNIRC